MRLSINEEGAVQIDLEPDDEQIVVNIGPAEVLCFGAPSPTQALAQWCR